MTSPETWSDGSPIVEYPHHDEVYPEPEPIYEPEMPDLTPHPYVELILEPVDASSAWQTLGLKWSEQNFTYDVISRGPVPRVDREVFGDIAENVVIHTNPEDNSYRTTHALTYTGDLPGLEMFRDVLTTSLDYGAEGNRDMIIEAGGPLLWLSALLSSQ